ncbi:MAG: hypothetical protein ACLTCB_00320 [Merdibacter sp.]
MLPVIFLLFMEAVPSSSSTDAADRPGSPAPALRCSSPHSWYQLRLREKPKKVKKVKRSKKELDEMIVPGVND